MDLAERLDSALSDFHQRLLHIAAAEAGTLHGLYGGRAAPGDDAASLCSNCRQLIKRQAQGLVMIFTTWTWP